MTSKEFSLWMARYQRAPFGTEWDNVRSAAVSANISAALGVKKVKIEDHIPRPKRTKKRQSISEMRANMNKAAAHQREVTKHGG